jgi:hypothetical protein
MSFLIASIGTWSRFQSLPSTTLRQINDVCVRFRLLVLSSTLVFRCFLLVFFSSHVFFLQLFGQFILVMIIMPSQVSIDLQQSFKIQVKSTLFVLIVALNSNSLFRCRCHWFTWNRYSEAILRKYGSDVVSRRETAHVHRFWTINKRSYMGVEIRRFICRIIESMLVFQVVLFFRNIRLFDPYIIYYPRPKVYRYRIRHIMEIHWLCFISGELAPAILATIRTPQRLIDVVVVHMGNDRDDLDRQLQAKALHDIMKNRWNLFRCCSSCCSSWSNENDAHFCSQHESIDLSWLYYISTDESWLSRSYICCQRYWSDRSTSLVWIYSL